MALKPKPDDVIVIPLEDPDISPGGIILTEAKQKSDQGLVKYAGDNVPLKFLDHVIFSPLSGSKVVIEGEGHLVIIPYSEILAVIDDSPTSFLLTLEQIEDVILSISMADGTDAVRTFARNLVTHFNTLDRAATEF